MHVQHGLSNVRREWLAQTLPHLVAIAFTFFKQVVVLKTERPNTHALDLDQHVFAVDVDVTVCVPEEQVFVIRDRQLSLHHDARFFQPVLPLTVNLVTFFKDIQSLETERLFGAGVSLDGVPRRARTPVLLAYL